MIAKLLLQNTFFLVAIGALLFASAGTLHWPGAWALLATSALLVARTSTTFARPASFASVCSCFSGR